MTSAPPPAPEWVPFVNVTAEDVPAGAVVEPAGGYDGRGRVRVRKCTADDSYAVCFNSPMACPAASPGDPDEDKPGGLCRAAWPLAAAAVHPADLAGYARRSAAGTKAGDWYLRASRRGFLLLDDLADGLTNVMPTPPAAAGGADPVTGGIAISSFSSFSLTRFGMPTGYSNNYLGAVTDTLNVRLASAPPSPSGNRALAVLFVPKVVLFADPPPGAVTDSDFGWISVIGDDGSIYWDLGSVRWPGRVNATTGAAYLTGGGPYLWTTQIPAANTSVSVSLNYKLWFSSPGGFARPTLRFTVCTTALVLGDSGANALSWLDGTARGGSPQTSCPSTLTVS